MPEVTTNSKPAFDAAARSYDADFTETGTGKLQRELVHAYLAKTVLNGSELKILELNCGTGEDAIWMAGKGAQVLATDLSGEMVRLGKDKWDSFRKNTEVRSSHGQAVSEASPEGSPSGTVEFRQMDLRQAMELDTQFDLVFSNFGGLNCISPQEFSAFLDRLPDLLNPNGRFIAVIMPPKGFAPGRHCIICSNSGFGKLLGECAKVLFRLLLAMIHFRIPGTILHDSFENGSRPQTPGSTLPQ